jgi:hypothetical protein
VLGIGLAVRGTAHGLLACIAFGGVAWGIREIAVAEHDDPFLAKERTYEQRQATTCP